MSLFNILNMTGSALQSQRAGLAVTANNIANANTDGYHRQSVDYQTVGTEYTGGLLLGQGVTAADVVSAFDRYTEERLLSEHANYGYAETLSSGYEVLESMVAVTGDGSLAGRLSDFLTAIDGLATTPWENSVRTQVLIDAESLATEFRRQAESLDDMLVSADEAVAGGATSVNGYLSEIASLNAQIASLEASGQTANDLRDQRGTLVDAVARQMGVETDEQADGTLTVFVAGHAVVQGDNARTLISEEDPNTGLQRIMLQDGGVALNITNQIQSGEIASQLEIRDSVVPALSAELDQIAYDLVTNFNSVHATGYDLNGNTGNDLFLAPAQVSGAAANMQLDTALVDNPDGLAASVDAAGLPGDGQVAIALGDLADSLVAGNGSMTLNEALSSFVGGLASDAAVAHAGLSLQTGITSAVEGTWEARSAVSQEEEAINLLKYQDAYDAMARVLQVTQEMLDTLMSL